MAQPFRMTVQDLYTLSGLGVAVTGTIEAGSVKDGDALDLVSGAKRLAVRVLQLETFKGRIPSASAGPEEISVVLSGVTREQVAKGQVLMTRQS